MEYSPKEKRGINSAKVMLGFPLAYVSISALTLLMLQIAPSGDPSSAYSTWGWRIPFFIGGAARPVLRHLLQPPGRGERGLRGEAPTRNPTPRSSSCWARDAIGGFAQVFLLMTGFWLSLNAVTTLMPSVLKDTVGMSAPSPRSR